MNVAQKMVLIPETEYSSLLNKPQNQIKKDMKEVLKGKRDHESATKMSQLIGSYLRFKHPRKPPAPKKPDFTEFFEPIYHRKVKYLLSQLHEYGVEWTDNKELVLSNGVIIPHSNIVDLIKEALVGTRKRQRTIPTGWQEFLKILATINLPKSFFPKKTTLHDLAEHQEGHEWEMY